MNILVINAGSSSVKFTCMSSEDFSVLASGAVERIGLAGTVFQYKRNGAEKITEEVSVKNTSQAVALITSHLCDAKVGVMKSMKEIVAVGHRVIHGGEKISAPTLIDENVKAVIEECSELAPLHNPPNLEGIRACEEAFPGIPQVGVFDTAFTPPCPLKLISTPSLSSSTRKTTFAGTAFMAPVTNTSRVRLRAS